MKRLRLLVTLTFVLGLLAFILTIGDYLALHDISRDYVSNQVLRSLGTSLRPELPAWTETRTEWAVVSLSVFFRAGFLLLNATTLVLCTRALRHRNAAP
jgi:hypothetical protein